MDYRSVDDLNAAVRRLAWDLPNDVDRIVHLDGSSSVAASLLQQTTGLPVVDTEEIRGEEAVDGEVLLVLADHVGPDESVERRVRPSDLADSATVRSAAVYVSERAADRPDYWTETVADPCAFEWELLHPETLGNACVDIDGVLCRDPTPEENDDGPRYREFLTTVEPRLIPDTRVGWLVTCRLEQYRPETEQWLDEHGIEYDELVMWDLPSKAVRDERGGHGEYKADVYEATGASSFVESSRHQAIVIARQAEKPVYCFDENQVIPPGEAADEFGYDPLFVRFAEDPRSFVTMAGRYVAAKGVSTVGRTVGSFR
ncbi:orotate phosphoribosyltransferase [Halomarina salina]|uniref:Orotate phosphoribosyltransferase n=1 Tax=Halomarina salina TaxID=1872699 RepID=A0ABD5RQQ9_9EURY|nr:orotate phosphoribosyltransferase [Halomarina salina]